MYGSQSSRPEGFLQKKPFFQKTAIMFLGLYLMSSSIVRMNMNMKKSPAPPRKCHMSCLISKSNQQDGIFTWSSPIIVLEHLARHIQFPRLCRRQICIFLPFKEEEVDSRRHTDQTEHCNIEKVKNES